MKKIIIYLGVLISMISCGSTKQITTTHNHNYSKTNQIIKNALYFKGTKYKYGGTSKKGMDCSGLIYTAFKQENILLPRISRDMATQGETISIQKIKKGDLLFFATGKLKRISHVGLVTSVKHGQVSFIHSSTKRGVIISSMNEIYYKNKFIKARRIL